MTPADEARRGRGGADDVVRFWEAARGSAGLGRLAVITGSSAATAVPPPTWAFGGTPEEADDLLALVLAGTKTATASARWLYERDGEPLPCVGDLSIVLDGMGRPRALVRTTSVQAVPFEQVDADHAVAEGEGDLSLEHWQRVHEDLFRTELESAGRPFRRDMGVVLERLALLHPRPHRVAAGGRVLV